MNPFVEHPILKDLPFELMREPSVEGIETFLKARQKKYQRLGLAYAAFGVIMLLLTILTAIFVEHGLAFYLQFRFVWVSTIFRGGLIFQVCQEIQLK